MEIHRKGAKGTGFNARFNPRARDGRDCACVTCSRAGGKGGFCAKRSSYGLSFCSVFKDQSVTDWGTESYDSREPPGDFQGASGSRGSYDQGVTFQIEGFFCSMMFDAIGPVLPQEVESETVFIGRVDLQECVSKAGPLCWVEETFKNRVLHALAIAVADFGNASETAASRPVDG